ncbi:MAG: outer membrane protein assembly factor BamE [Burkholderiaceae bacterium]|nr:MAG: outer membrane protein assembly factor BamE [Burkholderiaceae bacterium]
MKNIVKRSRLVVCLGVFALVLSGCESLNSYVPNFIAPHKVEIQQGNVVTPEQVSHLQPGMTRDQVRFLLGTPLLSDIFHTNRWDYLFRLKKSDGSLEEYKLTVFFDENRLRNYTTTLSVPKAEAADNAADNTANDAPAADTAAPAIEATPAPVAVAPVDASSPPSAANTTTAAAQDPAPQAPATPSFDAVAEETAVRTVIESWRAAWSGQDVKTYLSHYARSFKPQDVTRSVWQVHRKIALTAPKTITVTLDEIEINVADAGHASAQFRQDYRSDRLTEAGRKTLTLVKEDGQWKIAREQFSK